MRRFRTAGYVMLLLAAAVLATGLLLRATGDAGPPADLPLPMVARVDRPLRLAVMGTSLSARYAWPRVLAERLSACLPQPLVLRVFAEPGQGSAWGATQLDAVTRFAPDIVLVEFLANDSELRQLRSVAGSRDTHRSLIAALREGGQRPSIALMTMNPAFGLRGLLRPRLGAFHAMYADLAREAGTGLIDVTARWQRVLAGEDHADLLPDGLHPTEAAQTAIMLEATLPILSAALAEAWPACASLKP